MKTERLTLRPWRESDAPTLFKYASDPDVGPRAGWPPHKNVNESLEIIRTVFGLDSMWAMELKSTGEPIGCIGYLPQGMTNIPVGENEVEIGYWVAKPYWNQGLCSEALRELIRFCFNEKGFSALWGDCFIDNPASGKVMSKCGFTDCNIETECPNLIIGNEKKVIVMKLENNIQKKIAKYQSVMSAVVSLVEGETDEIAKMANVAALLHREFGFWWTGFYRVQNDELVLGPFQGPLACVRIPYGKGVCGTAWAEKRTVVVPDVEKFPGHIACSSESRSEIVVPVTHAGNVVAVLDIDSRELNTFDDIDSRYLEQVAACLDGSERDIWFAAGCFWGAQKFFKKVDGVTFTEVGFANGKTENPTYKEVYTDATGHAECVHIRYNPAVISLSELTELYFKIIDPFSLNKQGEDEGTRYRTGVYYRDECDKSIIERIFKRYESSSQKLMVELLLLQCFYKAEEYHQDYLDKNPNGYCHLSPEIFKLAEK